MRAVRYTLDRGHRKAKFMPGCCPTWGSAYRIAAAPHGSLWSSMADRVGSWMDFPQLRPWNAFSMPIGVESWIVCHQPWTVNANCGHFL